MPGTEPTAGRGSSPAAAALTARETQILDAVSHGHTVARVAADLGLTVHTVSTHLARIFRKWGVRNQAGAVAEGFRRGLLHPRPTPGPTVPLGGRDARLVYLIARGLSNGEIAGRLWCSEESVKSAVRVLLRRLGAVSRQHAVRRAFEAGVLRCAPVRRMEAAR